MSAPLSAGQPRGEAADELQRRAVVERRESFKDRSERFDREAAATASDEERQQLHDAFAAERAQHRAEDVARGNRLPSVGVIGRQVMWLSWIDIAVCHELEARCAHTGANPSSAALGEEFSAALVAVTSSALSVEALYAELKYLVPSQKLNSRGNKNNQFQIIRNTLAEAFGLDDSTKQRIGSRLQALFERRNFAVHPYSEMAPLAPHPSGVMTTAELSQFNAQTSKDAVDSALDVLAIAAAPVRPANRWIERWVSDHAGAHTDIVGPLRARR
ncbi:hypothetical protein [Nocardia colli]|uniref:hypothetical protein n=1 Tax=Nocardia colli TaxID=2545717 RepID=UPI0035D9E4BA